MIKATRVDVTAAATLIFNEGKMRNGLPVTSVMVKNLSAGTVYIGETNAVTTATGFPLEQNQFVMLSGLGRLDLIWGITASGTSAVALLQQSRS